MKILKKVCAVGLSTALMMTAVGCNQDESNHDLFHYDDYSSYVTLGNYKDITVEVAEVNVTDDEVTNYINSQLKTKTVLNKITDRTVQTGDIVNIDYVGTMDGKEFTGGSAKGTNLEIGSGSFIPGFEDGLIGAESGEEVVLNVTFPENYDTGSLAGKDAVFTVKINYFGTSVIDINEIKDRKVAEGDIVNIDFVGYVDGEVLENGSNTDYDLEIGSDSFIEGFEDGLIGATPGEEKVTLNLKFPDTYSLNAELAGKEVVFEVTVNYINEYIYPELTDEMVTQISSDYDNVKDYRTSVLNSLVKSEETNYSTNLRAAIWTEIEKVCKVNADTLPQEEVDFVYNENVTYYQEYAEYYGTTLESFLKTYYGVTVEDFEKSMKENAQEYVSQMLIVYAIAKAEGIEITDEEYQAGLEEYYESAGYTSAQQMEEDLGKTSIENRLLYEKVMQYFEKSVKVVEPTAE